MDKTAVFDVLQRCTEAIHKGELIRRETRQDKEFHFQNWARSRLEETAFHYEPGGRNSYPDFRIVELTEGYEVKGLAYPGREINYDCNSQVPSGSHNGRTIYYLFGRYPVEPDGDTYPVLDLVLCHGDFLNADHEYVHKNRNIKGVGSYGDIMIRDRKMYVAPTPFGLVTGVAHSQTLILPEVFSVPRGFHEVGRIARRESQRLIVGYTFDLRTNTLTPETIANPDAGREHRFTAWRWRGGSREPVSLRELEGVQHEMDHNAPETCEDQCLSRSTVAAIDRVRCLSLRVPFVASRAGELAQGDLPAGLPHPQVVGESAGIRVSRHDFGLPTA